MAYFRRKTYTLFNNSPETFQPVVESGGDVERQRKTGADQQVMPKLGCEIQAQYDYGRKDLHLTSVWVVTLAQGWLHEGAENFHPCARFPMASQFGGPRRLPRAASSPRRARLR